MEKTTQSLITFDSKTGKKIGSKKRIDIHRQGDWHQAVTAFIVRKINSGIEILVQERSNFVDISTDKIDQSLATQVSVDDKDPLTSLLRGLKEELGIDKKHIKNLGVFRKENFFKVIKKYPENKDLYNREIVTLYGVFLDKFEPKSTSIRVKKINWMKFEDFCELVQINPKKFTKTVRLFCVNEKIAGEIINFLKNLLINRDSVLTKRKIEYYSFYNHDVLIEFLDNKKVNIELYDTTQSIRLINKKLNALYDKIKIEQLKTIAYIQSILLK